MEEQFPSKSQHEGFAKWVLALLVFARAQRVPQTAERVP